MAVHLQPLADWVVAEQEEAVTKTASGLYLPDKAAEKPKVAKVLKVGPGKRDKEGKIIPMMVKVGDRILYKGGYGTSETVKLGDKEYVLVKEEDILATVNEGKSGDTKDMFKGAAPKNGKGNN